MTNTDRVAVAMIAWLTAGAASMELLKFTLDNYPEVTWPLVAVIVAVGCIATIVNCIRLEQKWKHERSE